MENIFCVTEEWLTKSFDELNQEVFNGKLNKPKLTLNKNKSRYGVCKDINGDEIGISTYFKRTKKQYVDTLVHEMVHLYFFQQRKWGVGHGREFKDKCEEIRIIYGYNPYPHDRRVSRDMGVAEIKTTDAVLIYLNEKDKYFFIKPSNVQYAIDKCLKYNRKGKEIYSQIVHIKTKDSKVASRRGCRTRIAGYYISKTDYDRLIQEAEFVKNIN